MYKFLNKKYFLERIISNPNQKQKKSCIHSKINCESLDILVITLLFELWRSCKLINFFCLKMQQIEKHTL